MFTDHPPFPPGMARKKAKNFKTVSNVHLETVATQDWSSFLKLEKQDASMRSAYVDKVRISWCLDTDEADAVKEGLIFVASHDNALDSSTPANNDGNIISATASRGAAGVCTLDIKRRITIDYDGSDVGIKELLEGTAGAPIYLHAYKANTGSNADFYLVVETWGRWLQATSL